MVTKILKFPHTNHITQLTFKIGPRILLQTGGFGCWPIKPSQSNFRQTHPCCHGNKNW